MTETATQVSLSANAAKQIKTIMAKQGFDKYLRVAVEGGGCSGSVSYTHLTLPTILLV